MSIGKECSQDPQPNPARLAKALSWHYPNREYFNSLLLEKHRQDLEYALLRCHLERSKLEGVEDKGKCDNLRIRLSRLGSFNAAKTITKTSSGLNHTSTKDHEQTFSKQLNHSVCYETNQYYNFKDRCQSVQMEDISRNLRAVGKATKASLKGIFHAYGEDVEQGQGPCEATERERTTARRTPKPKQMVLTSPSSNMALPEMDLSTTSPAEKVEKIQLSPTNVKPGSPRSNAQSPITRQQVNESAGEEHPEREVESRKSWPRSTDKETSKDSPRRGSSGHESKSNPVNFEKDNIFNLDARESRLSSQTPKATTTPEMTSLTLMQTSSAKTNAWEEAGAPRIPTGLTTEEQIVYKNLIRLRKRRDNVMQLPNRVVVITDLGKDYDDLAAMVILKELHRLGLIRLEGFIANLHPPEMRAKFGRCALDSLGLQDIPIAWGEECETIPDRRRPPHDYEFKNCKFMEGEKAVIIPYGQEKPNNPGAAEIESGVTFLDRLIYERLPKEDEQKQKLTFLLISGLSDIATYAKREPEFLAKVTKNVVLQGGYSIEKSPSSYNSILTPNLNAANNSFDKEASKDFHAYMDNHHIESTVFTREAAVAAAMRQDIFKALKETGHPIGIHLADIQVIQDMVYYDNACFGPRFSPERDQRWFLEKKTCFFDTHPKESTSYPTTFPAGDEVILYLNVVLYDALAAIGSAGEDVMDILGVLQPSELLENQDPHIQKIVGLSEAEPGINRENMELALTALLKGSLLASQQGIPSQMNTTSGWKAANDLAAE